LHKPIGLIRATSLHFFYSKGEFHFTLDMALSKTTLLCFLLGFAACDAAHDMALPDYPLFKQCDSRWAQDEMGTAGPGERNTVCHEGCAMSCVSMILAGLNITVGATQPANPGSLNSWLVANQGYTCAGGDCNNLVLNAPDSISHGRVRLIGEWGGKCCGGDDARPSLETLQQQINTSSVAFIAHVRNNSHFVLLTSWDQTRQAFAVNDPGFDQTHYPYQEISDILMYSLLPAKATIPKVYPLWEQFSYQWKDDKMVNATIGAVGCLMSSTSMALAGHGIAISTGMWQLHV
jgi:hypothetical protein